MTLEDARLVNQYRGLDADVLEQLSGLDRDAIARGVVDSKRRQQIVADRARVVQLREAHGLGVFDKARVQA